MNESKLIEDIKATFGADPWLLSVSIGPVQEFVAEARKVRDLWAGSRMLSMVVIRVIECIKKYGGMIVFPHLPPDPLSKPYSPVPNQFLAVVENNKIGAITTAMKTEVGGFLPELGNDIRNQINTDPGKSYGGWDSLWDFQLKNHFSLSWVALPVTKDNLENCYVDKYLAIRRLMEERKVTRTFAPWNVSSADKCTLCGKKEAMGPEDSARSANIWDAITKSKAVGFRIKAPEKLCAVCLVKRLVDQKKLYAGSGKISFDSTSDVASVPFRKKLESSIGRAEARDFVTKCNALSAALGEGAISSVDDIPGDWLYSDGLCAGSFLKEYAGIDSGRFEDALNNAAAALREVEKSLDSKACKYYAVIAMDGDGMGRYFSGGKMPAGKTFSLDWQSGESKKLSELQETFAATVTVWGGSVIYSGGDDLLAVGPLEGALSMMERLRASFIEKIDTTISAGMVIAHHQGSLRKTLDAARGALDTAKDKFKRDAFVVTLRLSSGSNYSSGYKWSTGGVDSVVDKLLLRVSRWIVSGGEDGKKLGVRFVYDLISELPAFYEVKGAPPSPQYILQEEMFKAEFERLFKRHVPNDAHILKDVGAVKEIVAGIACARVYTRPETIDTRGNLESLLKTITFFAREGVI